MKIEIKKNETIIYRSNTHSHTHTAHRSYCEPAIDQNQLNEVVNSNEMSMNKIKQKHGTHINRVLLASKTSHFVPIDLPSLSIARAS